MLDAWTFADPAAVATALDEAGYLPDDGVATAAYLAMRLSRPLFLEGDPGVGKTALAQALATITGAPLVRLQCYEGIDASQALYDWDFPRQVLHLRAAGDGADRDRRSRRRCTTGASSSPGRSCRRSRPARRCCSSTRSTAPTTSSRRSCSRCSPTTR